MLRKIFFIFIFVLVGAFSSFPVLANTCPSASPQGVGCTAGNYYCGSGCFPSTTVTWCPTWSPSPTCANGLNCANCSSADSCGVCNSCNGGYQLCGAYPNKSCVALPANCTSLNSACDTCTACAAGYTLSGGNCVAATLKLGSSSVSGASVIQGGADSSLFVSGSSVGIGLSNPSSKLTLSGGDFAMDSGKSIAVNNGSVGTTLYVGNFGDERAVFFWGSTTTSPVAWPSSLVVEGDVKGNRICIRDDCKAAWSEIVPSGSGNQWILNGSNLYASSTSWNVGIGLTNPSDLFQVHRDQLGFTGIRITNAGSVDSTTRSGIRFGEAAGSDYGEISWYRNGSDELRIENKVSAYGDITFRTGASLERLRIDQSGNIGINTTTPVAKLAIASGTANVLYVGGGHIAGLNLSPINNDQAVPLGYLNNNYFKPGGNSFGANSTFGLNDNYRLDFKTNNAARMTIASNGNVGIGTTNPSRLMHIYSTGISQFQVEGSSSNTSIQNGQVTLIFKNSNSTDNNWESMTFQGANGTVASIDVQNINHTSSYGELNFSTRGADGFVNRLIVKSNGNIGIGTTNPTAKLEVNGNLTVSGTGKITANTIDPPYLIDGRKYATYMSGMTGVKEETTGVAILRPSSDRSFYYHVLDIGGAEEGSDLWLFSRTANLKKHGLDSVTVLLAPNFSGRVWYEKDNTNQTITIKATGMKAMRTPEVSYRLSAPRFDFAEYGNRRPDSDPYEGLNLDKLLK